MERQLRDLMTPDPAVCRADATAADAAALMRDRNIGDVLVQDEDNGSLGIVTDRDIVTRAVADARDPKLVRLSEIWSANLEAVNIDSPVEEVIRRMSDKNVRRIPVVDGQQLVGIVSLGDLAIDRDPSSVLADISAAPPNK